MEGTGPKPGRTSVAAPQEQIASPGRPRNRRPQTGDDRATLPASRVAPPATDRARPRPRGRRLWHAVGMVIVPIALLLGCAVLMVGAEVIEHHLYPNMHIGWRHALLTARAGLVTAVGCAIVYSLMRRQQIRLSQTARQLSALLQSYQGGGGTRRFENIHLVHCRDVLSCTRSECPMFEDRGPRCWQVVALGGACRGEGAKPVAIQQCHQCPVYRQSCPDGLTELGESFNNLLFLLEAEAKQVGRMRAHLVEKEKMVAIGQMASGIAHEVGNPLSSISSIVQMLKRAGNGRPDKPQLDLIQTHIRRISSTVRQLACLARPASDRWEVLDLGALMEDAVRLVSFDRRARNVEIDFQKPKLLPETYGMRGQIEQVVLNLALNALDAMADGGRLTICAERDRNELVIRVGDTGVGIPPQVGRRVFEPFFTTKEAGRGTGLGLSVSYGIVHEHGGSIDFKTEVGKGTEFIVRIPILQQPPGV